LKGTRAFIAADISNRDAIEKLQQELFQIGRWHDHDVRHVVRQNLHFTLIFLNEIDLVTIERIKDKLSELSFEPIKINYSSLGGFPASNFAKVIWVGVDEEGKRKFISLAESVTSKIKDIGIRPDKPFRPHMTIFRLKSGKLRLDEILSRYTMKTFGTDVIERISLKMSTLTPLGPTYSDMFTVHAK
jgi:RNA 2',3'-cyclic 3'-phosphodiesterase